MQAETQYRIRAAGVELDGDLAIVPDAAGIVVFAHGSGSTRHSPRNRAVAAELHRHGLATLLPDLLTTAEEVTDARTREYRFDIPLLAGRLVGMVDWLGEQPETARLTVGLFGASTGAAAALVAAADRPLTVRAVVSRGGRPDLAGTALPEVAAPTLLIVGERDTEVLQINEAARQDLRCRTQLRLIPGATHLFEEPGALEQVASAAAGWFGDHLPPARRR